MKYLSLFTGYGGIDLALQTLQMEPIAYVEIEKYAQKIIASRMADGSLKRAKLLADVRKVRGSPGVCDLICGGFPCQDISVAGSGAGLAGERSGLFYEVVRLTKEIRPAFVFLENVPAIRTRGLYEVIRTFTEIGYDCRWTCLSASSVGAPHKRERWFLLAYSNSSELRDKQQRQSIRRFHFQNGRQTKSKFNGSSQSLAASNGVWEQPKQKDRQHAFNWIGDSSENIFKESHWTVEPDVGRVANGVAFRVYRIKALGNGVVPIQVRTAFLKLLGVES